MHQFESGIQSNVLQNIFFPQVSSKSWNCVQQMLLILAGVCTLAISAQLSIPFYPVPLTFQSATVILIGLAYGARYAASVVLVYLLSGAMGMPIFANFSFGWQIFLDPAAGYLLGFLPAAILSGYLAEKGMAIKIWHSFFAALLSALVIFSCGVFVLTKFFSFNLALQYGFYPFVISETIKLFAVACCVPKFWKKTN